MLDFNPRRGKMNAQEQVVMYKRQAHALNTKCVTESRGMTAAEGKDYNGLIAKLEAAEDEVREYDRKIDLEEQVKRNVAGGNPGASTIDHASFGELMQDVYRASVDGGQPSPRLAKLAAAGMGEGAGVGGGFLVDTATSDGILQRVFSSGAIAKRLNRMPPLQAGTNSLSLPFVDETSRVNGSRLGGVRCYWGDEAEATTLSKPKVGELNLKLKRLTALCAVTEELLSDSVQLGAFLDAAFTSEIRFALEDAVLRGTGAGQPLGWLNSPSKIVISKEVSQANGTILYANAAKMLARLHPASWATAAWYCNVSVLPQLLQMVSLVKNVAGTENVGGGGPVYDPNTKKLLGIPVEFIEQAEAIGTPGDISLIDNGQYLLIEKAAESASSIHVYFNTFQRAFRWMYRVDGMPSWKQPLTPFKGADTTSPCIVLEQR